MLAVVGVGAMLGLTAVNRHLNHVNEKNQAIIVQLQSPISESKSKIMLLQQIINNMANQRDNLLVSAYQREEVNLGPDDAYETLDHGNFSPNDTEDRTERNCKEAIHHKNAAVILTLGHSNAANTVNSRIEITPHVLNFNIFDGRCYIAQ